MLALFLALKLLYVPLPTFCNILCSRTQGPNRLADCKKQKEIRKINLTQETLQYLVFIDLYTSLHAVHYLPLSALTPAHTLKNPLSTSSRIQYLPYNVVAF